MLDPGGGENQKRSVLYNLLQLCTHGLRSKVHSMPWPMSDNIDTESRLES